MSEASSGLSWIDLENPTLCTPLPEPYDGEHYNTYGVQESRHRTLLSLEETIQNQGQASRIFVHYNPELTLYQIAFLNTKGAVHRSYPLPSSPELEEFLKRMPDAMPGSIRVEPPSGDIHLRYAQSPYHTNRQVFTLVAAWIGDARHHMQGDNPGYFQYIARRQGEDVEVIVDHTRGNLHHILMLRNKAAISYPVESLQRQFPNSMYWHNATPLAEWLAAIKRPSSVL